MVALLDTGRLDPDRAREVTRFACRAITRAAERLAEGSQRVPRAVGGAVAVASSPLIGAIGQCGPCGCAREVCATSDGGGTVGYGRRVDLDRLRFLFGPDALGHLGEFDLDDEADRMELVERFAPLPIDASRRGARMAVRTVAVSQILADDPPETWLTAQRLADLGLDRDEVLSQLALLIAQRLSSALSAESTFDVEGYVEALEGLPWPERSAIEGRLVEMVRARPGIAVEELVVAVVDSLGSTGGVVEEMVDRVLDGLLEGPLHLLPDDRTVLVPDLVDGTTFTHRLSDAEASLGVLSVAFDLGALARIDTVQLVDGTEIDQFSVEEHQLGWLGPTGWLDRFEPDDLLACAVTLDRGDDNAVTSARATVRIDATAEPAVSDVAVGLVRAGYDELVAEPGLPVDGGELSWWLLFHHPGLFATAVPPLVELCEAAGLELRAGRVAHSEEVWRNDLTMRRFAAVRDLVPEDHWRRVLGGALEILDDPDAPVDDVRAVLDGCAEPEALDVLADVLFDHYLDEADEFELGRVDAPGRLFELVQRATTVARRPRETAAAEYLACVLYERCGAPEVAEAHLRRAGEAQPRLGPVVERLGWYRFDRGDAPGAMRWWRTLSELPDAAGTIEPFLAPATTAGRLGRNDPCWCGSGRKFKRCHQDATAPASLPDRVAWLCRKASLWLDHSTGFARDSLAELVWARATGGSDPDAWDPGGLDDDTLADLFADAGTDPIVFDAALHEGGLFGLFLRERAALLPEDEQLLAASWQTVERSVHEVLVVDPGVGMTVRDLATGEVAEVRERTASTQAGVGDRFCGRVVPDGATNQIIGGVFPVRAGEEATVLDLCASGDPVALCVWVGALAQPPRLVHTPGLADQLVDRAAVDSVLAGLGDDVGAEDAMAVLREELTRQAQARWIDERVPALGGLTPRQAAADPTRREQLERLLAEFDTQSPAGLPDGVEAFTYDVAALRSELGLG